MCKTGILGGTFDPVHIAHLIMVREAYEEFGLDRMLMIPAGMPPHKDGRRGAPDSDRLNMVRIAADDSPYIEVSDYEMNKRSKSFTVETLRYLHEKYPDDEFYFIMGADSLIDLPDWYMPEEICSLAVILAAVRNGIEEDDYKSLVEQRKKELNADIRILHTPDIGISSTDIRNRVRQGRSIKYMVSDEVEEYIKNHGLYSE